jgi:hypothetical protein
LLRSDRGILLGFLLFGPFEERRHHLEGGPQVLLGHSLLKVLPVVQVIQYVTELAHQFTLVHEQVVLNLTFFEHLGFLLRQRFVGRIKLVHCSSNSVIRFSILRNFTGHRHDIFFLESVQAIVADHPDEGAADGPVLL